MSIICLVYIHVSIWWFMAPVAESSPADSPGHCWIPLHSSPSRRRGTWTPANHEVDQWTSWKSIMWDAWCMDMKTSPKHTHTRSKSIHASKCFGWILRNIRRVWVTKRRSPHRFRRHPAVKAMSKKESVKLMSLRLKTKEQSQATVISYINTSHKNA